MIDSDPYPPTPPLIPRPGPGDLTLTSLDQLIYRNPPRTREFGQWRVDLWASILHRSLCAAGVEHTSGSQSVFEQNPCGPFVSTFAFPRPVAWTELLAFCEFVVQHDRALREERK